MKKVLALLLILFFSGCANKRSNEEAFLDDAALYKKASKQIEEGNYKAASISYGLLTEKYPYSKYYADSLVKRAEVLYKIKDYLELDVVVDEFFRYFPNNHPNDDFMHYILGLSYFQQILSSDRDSKYAVKANQELQYLISNYPHSKYSKLAVGDLLYTDNVLASKEMEIGRFYSRTGNIISSIGRFKNVLKNHSQSVFVPEAMYRLAMIHKAIGIEDIAQFYINDLRKFHSDTVWYKKVSYYATR